MRRILITGVAWFIWYNLAKRFLEEWEYVVGIDNLISWQLNNIKQLNTYNNFKFYVMDIRYPICQFENDFDEIYNLACPASPVFYQLYPVLTIETNTIWIQNMLNFSKWVSLLLHTSTSEVYWDPLVHPQKEDYKWNVQTIGPRACYDEWKRLAETLIYEYNKIHNNCRIIRIFNTYWPWMRFDDGRVVSNFIWQALHNEDLTIYWDWSQTRSFQYIDDLLNWMVLMMRNKDDFFWPVNIWTQFEFTMLELANKVLEYIPESRSRITFKPLPKDDPCMRKADNSLAKEKLWREPKISLEEWLKKTIEYFKNI